MLKYNYWSKTLDDSWNGYWCDSTFAHSSCLFCMQYYCPSCKTDSTGNNRWLSGTIHENITGGLPGCSCKYCCYHISWNLHSPNISCKIGSPCICLVLVTKLYFIQHVKYHSSWLKCICSAIPKDPTKLISLYIYFRGTIWTQSLYNLQEPYNVFEHNPSIIYRNHIMCLNTISL